MGFSKGLHRGCLSEKLRGSCSSVYSQSVSHRSQSSVVSGRGWCLREAHCGHSLLYSHTFYGISERNPSPASRLLSSPHNDCCRAPIHCQQGAADFTMVWIWSGFPPDSAALRVASYSSHVPSNLYATQGRKCVCVSVCVGVCQVEWACWGTSSVSCLVLVQR